MLADFEKFWGSLPDHMNPFKGVKFVYVDTAPVIDVHNNATIKAYFDYVMKAEQSGAEFPVDFDKVWPLAYTRKDNAKRALIKDFFEGEDYRIDVRRSEEILLRNEQNLNQGGRPEEGEETFHQNVDGLSHHLHRNAEMVSRHLLQNEEPADDFRLLQNEEPKTRIRDGMESREEIWLTTKCLEFFIARKVRPVFEIYRQALKMIRDAPVSKQPHHSNTFSTKRPRARSLPGPSSRFLAGMIETHAGQIAPFKGTVKELWIEMSRAGHNSPLWPSTPSQFGAQLNPILPLLAQKGIVITRLPRRGAGQMLVLTTGAPIEGAQPPELPLVERESLETRVGRLEKAVMRLLERFPETD